MPCFNYWYEWRFDVIKWNWLNAFDSFILSTIRAMVPVNLMVTKSMYIDFATVRFSCYDQLITRWQYALLTLSDRTVSCWRRSPQLTIETSTTAPIHFLLCYLQTITNSWPSSDRYPIVTLISPKLNHSNVSMLQEVSRLAIVFILLKIRYSRWIRGAALTENAGTAYIF